MLNKTNAKNSNTPLDRSDLSEYKSVTCVAMQAGDFRGVSYELLCQKGDRVLAGTALMRDARRPQIAFTAPVSGVVAKIEYTARRRLKLLQIEVDPDLDAVRFPVEEARDAQAMRKLMHDTGAWTSLKTRPFGNIPNTEAEPAAIFVTAIDNDALAPKANAVIELFTEEFRAAANALASISTAPVYVCHAIGYEPPVDTTAQLQVKSFPDSFQMGLLGAHINAICPIGFGGGEVWSIHYQDLISLGHLLLHGTSWNQRIITLTGNALKAPRYLHVPVGASIRELLADELLEDAQSTVLSGSEKYGQEIDFQSAFLSTQQRQITALTRESFKPQDITAGIVIPTEILEAVAPPGIYAVPLIRALQIGDVDRARELGALELVEEDLSVLSRVCLAQCNYGLLLRKVLDQLERELQ